MDAEQLFGFAVAVLITALSFLDSKKKEKKGSAHTEAKPRPQPQAARPYPLEPPPAHLEAIRRHKKAARQPEQAEQPKPKTPAPFLEGERVEAEKTVAIPEGITPPTIQEQPIGLYTEETNSERIKELRKAVIWSEILKRKF